MSTVPVMIVVASLPLLCGWMLERLLEGRAATARIASWRCAIGCTWALVAACIVGQAAPLPTIAAPQSLEWLRHVAPSREAGYTLFAAWALGALAVGGSWAIAWAHIGWMAHRDAVRLTPDWFGQRALQQSAVPGNRVWLAPRSRVAHCWGVWRPRILLPPHAAGWTQAERAAVLCHEAAHIERHDPVWLVVAELLVAILWFNPTSWLAARRIKRLSEVACDARVLEFGHDPLVYAGVLLREARHLRMHAALIGLGTRGGHLAGRLRLILDGTEAKRPRSPMRVAMARSMMVACTGLGVLATVVGFTERVAVPAMQATRVREYRRVRTVDRQFRYERLSSQSSGTTESR